VQVSVFNGAAKFESDRGAVDIASGQAAVISGEPLDVQLVAVSPSDFDQWAVDQDHRQDLAKLPQAVPPAVTGYQDLAAYGSWSDDSDYGQVWYPSDVPADWAPYRYGHWAWVDPWGWTWIDDAPWGFAPFHYGRWIARDDRWAWVPADIPPQPVYAPALVSFVGGDGWGVDLAAGAAIAAIGWVALAPHEVYHPHYHASEAYDRRINGRDWNAAAFAGHNATLNNFHNRQAATVVPTAAFTHAAPVQRASVHIAADQLARTRAGSAAVTGLRPSAFARAGRADPQAATTVMPRANASANVARGRVTATTPAALAQEKAPTAPGPHRVAAAARPVHANAPANAATVPRDQRNARAPNNEARPASPDATAGTNPQAIQRGEAPSTARGPQPNQQQRAEHPNPPRGPANANLAPHPAPPNQPAREAAHGAPNAPNVRTAPAQRDLAQRPAAPQIATQPRAEHAAREHAVPPNAPSRAAHAQPQQHAPAAPPPSQQNAALPHENPPPRHAPTPAAAPPHPEAQHTAPPAPPQARAAAPAPHAPPQVAHAPAPMPPHAAPPPHPAAPPAAPHPAAAPAPHPPAAPAPHAAPAAPAPHPAAAAPPHPAPAPAAKAAPPAHAADKDKKDQPH
jgi:hypothetical protein